MRYFVPAIVILFLAFASSAIAYKPTEEIVVFTTKPASSLQKILDKFTQRTGIKVKLFVDTPARLISKIKHGEVLDRGDVYLTQTLSELENAKNEKLLFPLNSETLRQNIPEKHRDPEGYWYGLSSTAIVFAYSKNRVNDENLVSYEDLANKLWHGRLVIGSFTNEKNRSFLAAMIKRNGEEKTLEFMRRLISNYSVPPIQNEEERIKAVARGNADLALVSSSAAARFMHSNNPVHKKMANEIEIYFPNRFSVNIENKKIPSYGAIINITGAAILKNTRNIENSRRLLEFLSEPEAQSIIANTYFEFPLLVGSEKPELLKKWQTNLLNYSDSLVETAIYTTAMRIADEAGWK